jgi:hypothetical protein
MVNSPLILFMYVPTTITVFPVAPTERKVAGDVVSGVTAVKLGDSKQVPVVQWEEGSNDVKDSGRIWFPLVMPDDDATSVQPLGSPRSSVTVLVKLKLAVWAPGVNAKGLPGTAAVASLVKVNTPPLIWAPTAIVQLAEPPLASRGVLGLQGPVAAKVGELDKTIEDTANILANTEITHHLGIRVLKRRFIIYNPFFTASSTYETVSYTSGSLAICDGIAFHLILSVRLM